MHLVVLSCSSSLVLGGFIPLGTSLSMKFWKGKAGAWEFLVFISAMAREEDIGHCSQMLF